MSKKESWKSFGKTTGNAFKNFGKAIAKTAKVAFGDDQNKVDENGESELKKAWKATGKGFGTAGSSLGKAAKDTFSSEPETTTEVNEEKIVDVESESK